MLKDLILTLALLCVCFILMITLNNWQFSAQTNLLISSIFISWTILKFVGHRILFSCQLPADHGNFSDAATV